MRLIRTHFKGPVSVGGNPLYMEVAPDTTPTARTGVAGTVTLAISDLNGITTNTGTTNTLAIALPAANTADNYALKVQLTVASQVIVQPASGDKIYLGGDGVANKQLVIANVVGNYADLYCDGTSWLVMGYSGALTKQS